MQPICHKHLIMIPGRPQLRCIRDCRNLFYQSQFRVSARNVRVKERVEN